MRIRKAFTPSKKYNRIWPLLGLLLLGFTVAGTSFSEDSSVNVSNHEMKASAVSEAEHPFFFALNSTMIVRDANETVDPYSNALKEQTMGLGFDATEYSFIKALNDQMKVRNVSETEDRLYMHFDKTLYQAGDDIWFSVYLLDGHDFSTATRSDVVHAELVAPNGTVIKKVKLITKNGRAVGDFKLDADAPGGAYKVKAHTKWQTFEPSPFLFEKGLHVQDVNLPDLKMKMDFDRKGYSPGEAVQIRLELMTNHSGPLTGHEYNVSVKLKDEVVYTQKGITGQTGKASIDFVLPVDAQLEDGLVNAEISYQGMDESISRSIPFHKDYVDLKFYPEGGDLVNGLSSKVAFQALDVKGKPMDVSGRLIHAETREMVGEFSSFHHGMGNFSFTPKEGASYYVEITKPNSIAQQFHLPRASEKKQVLNVTAVGADYVKLKVKSLTTEPVYVVLSVREQLYYADSLDLDIGSNIITIPTTNLPIGVARITLFNSIEIPVAERVFFASRDQQLHIEMNTDKESYLPREQVKATVTVSDGQGNPVAASLSLSVVDDKLLSFADDRSAHLLSKMLLEYDLRKKVEEPQIYFRRDKVSLQKLDYLMLTAGWRRFQWNNVESFQSVMPYWSVYEMSTPKLQNQLNNRLQEMADYQVEYKYAQTERWKNNGVAEARQELADALQLQLIQNFNQDNNQLNFINWNNNNQLNFIPNNQLNFIPNNQLNNGVVFNGLVGQGVNPAISAVEIGNLSNYNSGSNCHFVTANFVGMETLTSQMFVPSSGGTAAMNPAQAAEFGAGQGTGRKGNNLNNLVAQMNNNGQSARMPQHLEEMLMEARQFEGPEYDAAESSSSSSASRTDFRSTVYWNGNLEVDESGTANFSFYNNDDVSSFRITTEGVGANGMLGRSTHVYSTQIPLSITARMPLQLTIGDTVHIPIVLANNTSNDFAGDFKLKTPKGLVQLETIAKKQFIQAGGHRVLWGNFIATQAVASAPLSIRFSTQHYSDAIEETISIASKGVPVNKSFSANALDQNYSLDLKAVEEGSLKAKITLYPSLMADILTGVESILAEPNGCFEQTSATSYPNIMVMDYINESGSNNTAIATKAGGMIDRGYKKLVSFETNTNGYEWFGSAPGHEGLTAYGLMQFNDMKAVYSDVDDSMVKRTRNWLMSKRDGQGGFTRASRGLHNYGQISDEVLNGYIVYAMTEAGEKSILKEATKSNGEALTSDDPYQLAMSAMSMHNLGEGTKAKATMDQLLAHQTRTGQFEGTTHSITFSTGNSLRVETSALAAMSMMKMGHQYDAQLSQVIQFLTTARSGNGSFGSTQATVLALKALTQYNKHSKSIASSGTLSVIIDGVERGSISFKKGDEEAIVVDGLEKHLRANSEVQVVFTGTTTALPYTLSMDYTTMATPENSAGCKVSIQSKLPKTSVEIGSTIRLQTTVKNTQSTGLPSTMCVIGIPGGCSVQPWQLKELMDSDIVDYYELRDHQLICYFRGLAPNATKTINLDLKTEVAGNYTLPPSSAYLYYTNEFKVWTSPVSIEIRRK